MYRVIIADDEPLIVKGLQKMMDWTRLGTEVVAEAQDGAELQELLERERPDIIISDISMPGKNGLDIIREISERGMNTKVIFVSGFQEFSYAKAAIKYGAVDYLLKPVTVEELEKAIERAKEQLGDREKKWKSSDDQEGSAPNPDQETALAEDKQDRTREETSVQGRAAAPAESGNQTGIRFELDADSGSQDKNSSQFELIRFAVFRQIEELLHERGFHFWVRREECASSVVLELEDAKERERLERVIEEIRNSVREKFGLKIRAGIGAVPQHQFLEGAAQMAAQTTRPEHETIVKVKTYIQAHFAEELTLEQVAQVVYMNPYYFSTFFKRETGQNFKTYLLEVRMKMARQYLMEEDWKTYELARSVGYHDVRTFTEKFREFYGKSPAKYRKGK